MNDIIQIRLSDEQRAGLAPILDACRQANGYEGVLCTLARSYSLIKGGSVLQLQVVRVPTEKGRQGDAVAWHWEQNDPANLGHFGGLFGLNRAINHHNA